MTVKELIDYLSQFPSDAIVLLDCDDSPDESSKEYQSNPYSYVVLNILDYTHEHS